MKACRGTVSSRRWTRSAACGLALGFVAGWQAAAQPFPDRAAALQDESKWLTTRATAALVVSPPPVANAGRWVVESRRHRGTIHSVATDPSGTRLATAGIDGTVRIWNLETGELERVFVCHRWHTSEVAWSHDGTRLATNAHAGDNALRVWDSATGRLIKDFDKRVTLSHLAWSPDDKRLTGTHGASGGIFVSEDLEPVRVMKQIGQGIRQLEWSATGRLVCASGDNPVEVLDGRSGRSLVSFTDSAGHATTAASWSPDGTRIATNGNKSLTVWDAETGQAVFTKPATVSALAWSPDGTRIATVYGTALAIHDAQDGKVAASVKTPLVFDLVWHPKTDRILAVGRASVAVFRPDATEPVLVIDVGNGVAPVFRPGGPVVTGLGTTTLRLWDSASLKRLRELDHEAPVSHAVPSRDGKRLATADAQGVVRIWAVQSGESVRCAVEKPGGVTCLAWSADDTALAAGGSDKTVRVWGSDGAATATLEDSGRIQAVAWGPGTGQLAVAADDKRIVIWDVAAGTSKREIDCPFATTALAWTVVQGVPTLACGQNNNGIRLVNAATGNPLAVIEEGGALPGNPLPSVAWLDAAGSRLLVGRYRDLVHVFDVASQQRVQRQLAPNGVVETFPVAAGTVVVTRAADRVTRFWDPVRGDLFASLLDERGDLVAISATGDVAFDPATKPDVVVVAETAEGQSMLRLDEFARRHRWKNNGRSIKLPRKP